MKKIISIIIALTMVLSTVCAFAAGGISVNMLDVNLLDSVINVKLAQAEEGQSILLLVTNPGYDDTATDIKYAVQNYHNLTADAEGKAEYSFKLYAPQDGEYKIYANGSYLASFKYDVAAMKSAVDTIVEYAKDNKKTELETYIKDVKVLRNLALDAFEPIVNAQVGIDMGKVAEKLIVEVNKNTFEGTDKENSAKMQNIIKTVVALELLNQSKADQYIYNNDGSLIHDSALKLSTIDESKSVTLYEYYLNGYNDGSNEYVLKDSGKAAVKSALKGKNFASTEDLYKAFMEAVVLNGVNKSTLKGSADSITYGHIKGLLTNENKTATEVKGTVTNFVANKLAGTAEINSIEHLNSLISQYAQLESQQGGSTGGGGGGGGGASVPGLSAGGGITVTPVDNVDATKQNDKNANENYKYSFSDIAEVEWAIEAIEALTAKGIINGVGDRKFDPQGTVTREQFVKMLCVALGLTEEAEITFADIAADDWSVPYIKKAVKAGLISGVDENTFGYGVGISRQDIAVILHRTIKDTTGTAQFADNAEIADYAKDAVGALSGLKILNGFEDGSFKPNASCTRAQAAVIIYNYLNR
ncbi:MAG: S-layer homology domain-containing protein [Clostridia bacterium]|nr:S-layer homology domain-containing protein [Clostridia bacterium]